MVFNILLSFLNRLLMRTGSTVWRGMENERWRSKGAEVLCRCMSTKHAPFPLTGPTEICGVRLCTEWMNRTTLTIVFYFYFFSPDRLHDIIKLAQIVFYCHYTIESKHIAQATVYNRNRPSWRAVAGLYVFFGSNVKTSEKRDGMDRRPYSPNNEHFRRN